MILIKRIVLGVFLLFAQFQETFAAKFCQSGEYNVGGICMPCGPCPKYNRRIWIEDECLEAFYDCPNLCRQRHPPWKSYEVADDTICLNLGYRYTTEPPAYATTVQAATNQDHASPHTGTTELKALSKELERTTEVQHHPTTQVVLSNNNKTIDIVSICVTIVIVSLVLLAMTLVVCKWCNKQVVIPFTNQNAQQKNMRPPVNRHQNLSYSNSANHEAIMMVISSDEPFGVETQVTRHEDGTIHTDVLKSGDVNNSLDGARSVTNHHSIPPNARPKTKGENDSMSSTSDEERKPFLPKQSKTPAATSEADKLRATQNSNTGPNNDEGHSLHQRQSQAQPADVQEETRRSPHTDVTMVHKCTQCDIIKQEVDQISLTKQNLYQFNTRPPDNQQQNLYYGNSSNHSAIMIVPSSDEPIGVETQVTGHDDGTIHTDVLKSGDDTDSWDGARSLTSHHYIPPNARLKTKGEIDSTSTSSDDQHMLPKQSKKPLAASRSAKLRATQYGNTGPSHEGHPQQPPPQQQQAQPSVVQEESRSPHKSHLVISGHATPSDTEAGYGATHFVRDMIVQDSESGVDSPSSGAMSSESTSEDDRQSPSGNGVAERASNDNGGAGTSRISNGNLLSADNEINIASKDTSGAFENGACGISIARLNGPIVETTNTESAAAAAAATPYSGEDSIPCHQLADGVNFEADVVSVIAKRLDSWRYLIFLKHLDHPEDNIGANSTIHDYVFNFLCSWWQSNHTIGPILMALKKSGNEQLRDEIIKKFCKLD